MAEATPAVPNKNRYAVVTGSNKGIGFEICRQLACNGVLVVLTARDQKKGLEAVEKLNGCGLSDLVFFHQLDVVEPSSIASLVDFIKTKFGRLDILVNNAWIGGLIMDWEVFQSTTTKGGTYQLLNSNDHANFLKRNNRNPADYCPDIAHQPQTLIHDHGTKVMTQTYEMAEAYLQTNYYDAKRMIEAFIPLLKLYVSPRIVNVSSGAGQLQNIPGEWVRTVLNDVESLTKKRIDELINDEFLQDFKAGSLETRSWPVVFSAYTMSKAAMNAYSRILAKKNPGFRINCVCPGYLKTDINGNTDHQSVEEGVKCPVKLALLLDDGPTSFFFSMGEVTSF
ncbi:(+)-neomenthol dehydrogenase-like isoform X2 [Diospyros lotus]|uniref:(+)-neomenthol dehydrogenase-like isoform X1 n=1 Tax=Diospyros lotus TaxID=55363 RepID=UPI002256FE5B|nr:(+)-neomenthol dehydrogenase-like isoform X1 [Diospyros lotus]XP_052170710.1 (+)-neomenthol dehydrogenase-like isoform X1 [Diospyros lotus]XP_052170711.1 (+)-neomenthol dehydrogenase-like isoform X2 [Diospyros lotus]